MPLPLVSCIVPVHNGARYLTETLESILQQTYQALELIVVDDGSTDETSQILNRYSGRAKTFFQPKSGPASARNRGLKAASGEWVAFLDADDLWHPDKIRLQMDQLDEDPSIEVSFTLVRNFWIPELKAEKERFEKEGLVKLIHPYSVCSFLGRRSVFDKVGFFPEDLFLGEDSEWFIRMKTAGVRYAVLNEKLVSRRLHEGNLTRSLCVETRGDLQQRAREALARNRVQGAPCADAGAADGEKAQSLFRQADQIFLQAEKDRPDSFSRDYRIAGHSVRLRFAGAALESLLTPALRLLETPPCAEPELTIGICDFSGDPSRMPDAAWAESSSRKAVRAQEDPAGIQIHFHGKSGKLHLFHPAQKRAYFFVRSRASAGQPDQGAPLVTLLRWWLSRHGIQTVHGGVVGFPEAGVLLAGQGGAGKSTTALACLAAGLFYIGDDYVLLAPGNPLTACRLYSSGKLGTQELGRIPELQAKASAGRHDALSGKTLFFLNEIFPDRILPEMPLKAVFVPVISPQSHSELVKASPIFALRALAPSTLFQLPGSRQHDFYDLSRVVEKLPCYVLRLGSSMPGVTRVIRDYLSSL